MSALPAEVEQIVGRYLALVDRLLPGRVEGFYVVGSSALGAWRSGRSDVDGVAVLTGDLGAGDIRRLRILHAAAGARSGVAALRRGQLTFPGTCNVVFVRSTDLTRPVTEIVPVASHTGIGFEVGAGFDVNPVVWKVLAEQGITVRGPAPATLRLDPQPELLEGWNRKNLEDYWRPWAEGLLASSGRRSPRRRSRWTTAWSALGAPRLHHTIATGDVIAKEAAGEYALATFDEEWHPIIDEGLRWWRGAPPTQAFADPGARTRRAAELTLMVVDDAAGS